MSFTVFGEQNKLLPVFCKPFPDELLSSWIARMAFGHGLSTWELCKLIWPKYGGNPDIDRLIVNDNIKVLAGKTNCTIDQVNKTSLTSYKNILYTNNNRANLKDSWIIASQLNLQNNGLREHNSGLMYCPGCLQNKPFFKKQWRLALSFVCSRCGYYLIECCPHCGKGNSFIDTGRHSTAESLSKYMCICHNCGHDVTDCEPEIAPVELVIAQLRLLDIVDHGVNERLIQTDSYFKVLTHLSSLLMIDRQSDKGIRKLASTVYRLNQMSHEALRPYKALALRDLPVKKRAIVIQLAHWMLEDWPHRFVDLCQSNDINSTKIMSGLTNAPAWFWDTVEEELQGSFPKSYKHLDDGFDNCTVKTKNNVVNPLDYDCDITDYYYDHETYTGESFDADDIDDQDKIQRLYGLNDRRRAKYLITGAFA